MHFKISKNILFQSLQVVSKAVLSNSPIPVFSGIKIEVKKDELILIGSNDEISIRKILTKDIPNINLTIYEEGVVVIGARYLLEIVRKMDSDIITFEIIDGNLIKIIGNLVTYRIHSLNSNDYPQINFNKINDTFFINAEDLKQMIHETTFLCVKDSSVLFSCLNLKLHSKQLICYTTDRYRLAKKTLPVDSSLSFDILVPSKHINEIYTLWNDEIEIGVNNRMIQINNDDTIYQIKLNEKSFPELEGLIEKKFNFEILVDAKEIKTSLDRAIFIKNSGISIVKLELKEKNLTIRSESQEFGFLNEIILPESISYLGEQKELSILFNGVYMLEAISHLNAKKIKIKFVSAIKQFIIEDVDDDSVIQLILPTSSSY